MKLLIPAVMSLILLALAPAHAERTRVVSGTGEPVKFPQNYADGVLYSTMDRGQAKEEFFASRAAVNAVKNGQPIPSGTIITVVDYRDGKLFRYTVMEKRTNGYVEYSPEKCNGEWKFQTFNADKSLMMTSPLCRTMVYFWSSVLGRSEIKRALDSSHRSNS